MGRWCNPKGKDSQSTRECLRCGKEFASKGKFNRLCPSCQVSNSRVSGDYTAIYSETAKHSGASKGKS